MAYTPFRLGGLELKNRFIKTATNEGMVVDGIPTVSLTEHHKRLAEGGVGLTTVAYGAVNADGRTMPHQMYMRPEVIPSLEALTRAVHGEGSAVSVQLTHCGYFSNNRTISGKRPLAPSRRFNEYGALSGLFFSREMTIEDITRVASDFGNSARMSKTAGFDAVEIHMGHGYLLSQFLSPATNRRTDKYGGSLLNRARFPLEVLESVKLAVGEGFPVICKVNLSDDFKGGLTLEESIQVALLLEKAGADALVLSGGFTSITPFYLLRGDVPLWDMVRAEKGLSQKMAMALFGPFIIKKYAFSENFFLPMARKVREAVRMPLAYLGGVISSRGVETVISEGFDLVAIGRVLIYDPDFILKIREDPEHISGCTHCNKCVAEMDRGGVRCVISPVG